MGNIRPLVAGNWKMNGLRGALGEVSRLKALLADGGSISANAMICPSATLLAALTAEVAGSAIQTGGQDCHAAESGAHTGDISAEMLADAGATAVIVGHSERRTDHGETDAAVREKAEAAYRAGLIAIICVGETAAEREQGQTLNIVSSQLSGSIPESADAANTIIAYEPVWAIGTGLTPTPGDVEDVHRAIREVVTERMGAEEGPNVKLLYGGSVKPANARELMAVENVNGALVGGASLKADDFYGILTAYKDV